MVRRSVEAMELADQETLGFIADFQKDWGESPTYSEIAEGLGLAGKSSVQRRLDRLIARGLIVIEHPKAAIEIVGRGK